MTRSKLNFDIDADEAQEISAEDIRRATAASGFGGTGGAGHAAVPNQSAAISAAPGEGGSAHLGGLARRARPKTGRVHQFNTRLRAETVQAIQGYADRHGLASMAEVVERAIEALEREENQR